MIELPDQEKEVSSAIKNGKDTQTIKLVNKLSSDRRVRRIETHNVKSAKWVLQKQQKMLKMLITNEMLESVLYRTNTKIIEASNKLPENFNENWLYPLIKEVSVDELIAYLCYLHYRGLRQ